MLEGDIKYTVLYFSGAIFVQKYAHDEGLGCNGYQLMWLACFKQRQIGNGYVVENRNNTT